MASLIVVLPRLILALDLRDQIPHGIGFRGGLHRLFFWRDADLFLDDCRFRPSRRLRLSRSLLLGSWLRLWTSGGGESGNVSLGWQRGSGRLLRGVAAETCQ